MKKILLLLLLLTMAITFVGCKASANDSFTEEVVVTNETSMSRPVATIEFEDGKKIVIELLPEIAPNTVNNFISLIQTGYYDGLTFHRIMPGFMIQGGDPSGNGSGGPGYAIKDEFTKQDGAITKYISHKRGVVSMAKTQAPDSGGSQFFIMHQDTDFLNFNYSAFGYVVEGIEVVDELVLVETNAADKPLTDIVMKTVTVELNGYEFTEPETIQ